MARPARFSREKILEATARVAAKQGPTGTSVARIAAALRAPTGSIYHRFKSRSVLLGEVWLQAAESFQNGFFDRLDSGDPKQSGLVAVLYVPEWVRTNPQDARILLLHRREDFLERGWPAAMTARAKALHKQLLHGLRSYCKRLCGRTGANTLRVMSFALAEAPLAAVRRHVEAGELPPPIVDTLIEQSYRACLSILGVGK